MSGSPTSAFLRLWRHADRHRGRMLAAAACSVTNKLLDLAPPALIGLAIDVVVEQEESWLAGFGIETVLGQLWVLGILTVIVWALESAFEYAYAILWRNLAQRIQHELRLDTWTHVQDLDASFFEDRSTGGLLSILNDDVNQLERFLDGGANDLLQVATTVVVVGITFFALSVPLAIVSFLPVPFILWGSFAFQRRIAPRYTVVRERAAALNSHLSNALQGMATIRAAVAQQHEVARVTRLSEAYASANADAIRVSSAFSPLIRMVIVVGFTATLIWGGWMAHTGTLAVGSYGLLVFLTQRLLWPLTRLGQTFDLFQRAMASTRRILDLLERPPAQQDGEVLLSRETMRGDITFDNVSFAYPNSPDVVQGLNLEVVAGTTVGLVGATGAGKSTLLRLLLRLHDPTEGRVLVDGHPVTTLQRDPLRRAIGLVSQDVFLFDGTVADNVRYGTFDATDEDLVRAAALAEALSFIEALPQGWQTQIGERGQKLSGGQRQRLSIARALVGDPPVLLLDEATSAVDNETEAAIQRALAKVSAGRTVILVAHRLSTVRHADAIHVLDSGTVVESGTHEALLARNGRYARLWRVQAGERSNNEGTIPVTEA